MVDSIWNNVFRHTLVKTDLFLIRFSNKDNDFLDGIMGAFCFQATQPFQQKNWNLRRKKNKTTVHESSPQIDTHITNMDISSQERILDDFNPFHARKPKIQPMETYLWTDYQIFS